MAQLGLALIQLTGKTFMATFLLFMNGFAQLCCWYSVVTMNQFGHIMEESIWACSIYLVMTEAMNSSPVSRDGKWFKGASIPVAMCYVAFMILVDIPMYMDRYLYDRRHDKTYLTFYQGWNEIQHCLVVSQSDYWYKEMPWMTLYFSVAVWISLWLSQSKI
jgi:phosphatidylserine synthase